MEPLALRALTMFSCASVAFLMVPAASTASTPQHDLACLQRFPVDQASLLLPHCFFASMHCTMKGMEVPAIFISNVGGSMIECIDGCSPFLL
jgi:hypothetical protein